MQKLSESLRFWTKGKSWFKFKLPNNDWRSKPAKTFCRFTLVRRRFSNSEKFPDWIAWIADWTTDKLMLYCEAKEIKVVKRSLDASLLPNQLITEITVGMCSMIVGTASMIAWPTLDQSILGNWIPKWFKILATNSFNTGLLWMKALKWYYFKKIFSNFFANLRPNGQPS